MHREMSSPPRALDRRLAMDALPLVVPELGCPELLSARLVNKELYKLASEDHAWTGAMQALEMNFPLDGTEGSRHRAPRFPPRKHGVQRDVDSYVPVEPDLQHLVLPRVGTLTREEAGVVEDLFHPAEEDAGAGDPYKSRTPVWISRPLPLRCEPCGVICESYGSFAAHCVLFIHGEQLSEPKRRVPHWAIDPRHAESYAELPTIKRYAAVSSYRSLMLASLRSPMKPAEQARMAEVASWARVRVTARADDPESEAALTEEELELAISKCTPVRASHACVECLAVQDFMEYGLRSAPPKTSYAVDVIRRGWGAWNIQDLAFKDPDAVSQLLASITELHWY
ncbi:hypothetical protein T492DRAFT_1129409 [Pavlovales sp. CCMP2436]|nr:hypothetical protein T492DRAFT_1129409 [Pavlovales sp. CCMP2436]